MMDPSPGTPFSGWQRAGQGQRGAGISCLPPTPDTLDLQLCTLQQTKPQQGANPAPLKATHPHATQLPPHAFPALLLLPPPPNPPLLAIPPHFLFSPVICPPGAAIAVLRVQQCLGLGPSSICLTPPPAIGYVWEGTRWGDPPRKRPLCLPGGSSSARLANAIKL